MSTLPRGKIARASWQDFGAVILVRKLDEAAALANTIAAEHLEIMTANPEALSAKVRNAGAIFLGRIRRRRSAIMSAAPTMCCRRRGRRGSPRVSAYLTS